MKHQLSFEGQRGTYLLFLFVLLISNKHFITDGLYGYILGYHQS